MDVQSLQATLGYAFVSSELLQQALTHRSHSVAHNERLEFLGDSVLNCVVASLLYEKFARIDEGDLSRLRANLVKQQSLYEIAQRLELSPHLRLGEGELKSGGFRRPSILADTVEALFGAIFLDGGFDEARRVIRALYLPVLETVDPRTLGKDAKTLLQEYLQGRKFALPVYSVVATHGAAHSQEFEVECAVPKLSIQVLGAGGSRRAAEQAAAKKALEAAQALAVAATKRTRRAKPAQLSLPVAVEQQAALPSPDVTTTRKAAKSSDAKPSDNRPNDSRMRDARSVESKSPALIEPARIVAVSTRGAAEAPAPGKGDSKPNERRDGRPMAPRSDGDDAAGGLSVGRASEADVEAADQRTSSAPTSIDDDAAHAPSADDPPAVDAPMVDVAPKVRVA